MEAHKYNASNIKILGGLEAVRKVKQYNSLPGIGGFGHQVPPLKKVLGFRFWVLGFQ